MPDPETDIILSRANVALARSQRLVASWLSLSPAGADADTQVPPPKTEDELQREEKELFTAVPETLGLGAPLPTKLPDGSWNRAELDSNDALRRQLLGRNYQRIMKEKEKEKAQRPQGAGTGTGTGTGTETEGLSSGAVQNGDGDEDEDDEDGRTAAVGRKNAPRPGLSRNQKKRSKKRKAAEQDGVPAGEDVDQSQDKLEAKGEDKSKAKGEDDGQDKGVKSTRPTKKKATSFLDEILADRSKKRKKR